MKRIYPFLLLFFAVMLMMKHNVAFSQGDGVPLQQQQPPEDVVTVFPRIIDSPPTRDAGNPNPNPGSIWVNRDETINGKAVTSLKPKELVEEVLLGKVSGQCEMGGEVRNISFKGYGWSADNWTQPFDRALSYFSHGTDADTVKINGDDVVIGLGMESGLLLTTGGGRNAEGPNSASKCGGLDSKSPYTDLSNDLDLKTLYPNFNASDGAVLEFDFIPLQHEISFDYIFASEEYSTQTVNDMFAFLIWEVDAWGSPIGPKKNIALLPDGTTVVSIQTVNKGLGKCDTTPACHSGSGGTNPGYFVANYINEPYKGKYMEYNGRTVLLTAKANVIPGRTYHLKLIVVNNSDHIYGSGVFLRAGSLDLGTGFKNLGEGGLEMNNVFEGCTNELVISFPPSETEITYVDLEYSGCKNEIVQLDGSAMPEEIIVPLGGTPPPISYKVISPLTCPNGSEIQIVANTSRGNCTQSDTIILTVYSKITDPIIETTSACQVGGGSITVTKVTGGSPNARTSIDGGINWQLVGVPFSGLTPGDYELLVTDFISCDTLRCPIALYDQPELSSNPEIPAICSGETVIYEATCDLPGTTFNWTRAAIPGISPSTGSGINTPFINETLTNSTAAHITVSYVFTLINGDCIGDQEVTVVVYSDLLSQPDPTGVTIPYQTTHTFNLGPATGGVGEMIYLWQESDDGLSWSSAIGINNKQDYTTPALTCNKYYRRQATGDICGATITSNAALVTVSIVITLIVDPPGISGGSVTGGGTYNCGDEITIKAIPDICYNAFIEWTDDINAGWFHTDTSFTFTVTEPRTFTAHFQRQTHDLFVSVASPAGASTVSGAGNFECDTDVTVAANPDPCYDFVEWREGGVFVSDKNPYTFYFAEEHDLVAHFQIKKVNVTVVINPDEGSVVITNGGINIDCGTDVVMTITEDPCYTFVKWDDGNTDNPRTVNVTENMKFTAIFQVIPYDIILLADPPEPIGGTVIGGGLGMPCGKEITVVARPDECYTFVDWTEGGVWVHGNEEYTFTIDGPRTLTANFLRKEFNITATVNPAVNPLAFNGNNTVSIIDHNGNIVIGENITVTNIPCGEYVTAVATADNCFTFINWTEDGKEVSDKATYGFDITTHRNLVANFEITIFNIAAVADPTPGGLVSVSNEGIVMPYETHAAMEVSCGTDVTVTALTNHTCYDFLYWMEGNTIVSYDTAYTFTAATSRTLAATFQIKHFDVFVYVADDPPGSSSTATGGGLAIECGTSITLIAVPDSCYIFTGWTEHGVPVSDKDTLQFMLLEDRYFVAHFEIKLLDVIVSAEPKASGGIATGGGTKIYCGTTMIVEAIPDPQKCYYFAGWMEDGVWVSTDNPYIFVLKEDRDLIAVFEPEIFTITLLADPPEGGTVFGGGNFPCDMELTIFAEPDTCYTFIGWEVNGVIVSTKQSHTFVVQQDTTFVAKFQIKTFDIALLVNPANPPLPATPGGIITVDGSASNGGKYECGDEITATATANPGYYFVNWTDNSGTGWSYPDSVYTFIVYKDRILTANFELKSYDIVLFPNPWNGGIVYDEGHYPHFTEIIVHADPNPGYYFVKWTEKINGIETTVYTLPDYPFTVTGPRILTAHFDKETYLVTVVANPLDGGYVFGGGNYFYDAFATVSAVSKQPCFRFKDWTDENGNWLSGDTIYTFQVKGPRTLTANFIHKLCDISLSTNPVPGGTTTMDGFVKSDSTYLCGEDVTVGVIEAPGFEFVNWTEGGKEVSKSLEYTFTAVKSRDLVANFKIKEYNILLLVDPTPDGGNVFGAGIYPHGYSLTIEAVAKECYEFVSWTEEVNGVDIVVHTSAVYSFMVMESRILTAHFEKKEYNIFVLVNPTNPPPGGGTVTISDAPYFCGDTVKITATANFGYKFVNWTKNNVHVTGNAEHIFTATESCTYIANFTLKEYDIILKTDPPGAGTVTGGGVYLHGQEAEISTTPNPCYTFIDWTDEDGNQVATSPLFSFIVTGPKTLTANYEINKYLIEVVASPGAYGTVSGGGIYDCDKEVEVFADPNPGYKFINWTENGAQVSDNPYYSFIAMNDRLLIANFEPEIYNVILLKKPTYGGTVTGGGAYPYGEEITINAYPEKGWKFVSWTDEDDVVVSGSSSHTFIVEKTCVLTANFELETFNITLTKNPNSGGTTTIGDVPSAGGTYPYEEKILLNAIPNPGYDFINWTDKTGAVVFSKAEFVLSVMSDSILTANFELIDYTITVSETPPFGGTAFKNGTGLHYGDRYEVWGEPNQHYHFVKWTEYDDPTPVSYKQYYEFDVVKSQHLVAHFALDTIEITLLASPSAGGKVFDSGFYPYGEYITVHAKANDGYKFDRWTDKNGITVCPVPDYPFTVLEPQILTAHFTLQSYEIVLLANPQTGGTVKGDGIYPYGETITVEAEANPNYEFINWTDENGYVESHSASYTFEVKGPRTLTANFDVESFKIVLLKNPDNGGTVSGDGAYYYQQEATIKAEPNYGYEFVNWTEDGNWVSNKLSFSFEVTENRTFTANFTGKDYKITVLAAPPTGGTVEGGGSYIYEETATVTATAKTNYQFFNWTDEDGEPVSYTPEYSFEVTGDRVLTANFTFETYDIVLSANPPEGGTVEGAGNFAYNTPITVSAIADTLYYFVNWTEDDDIVSTNANFSFTVTEPRTLVANFEKIFYEVIALVDDEHFGHTTGSGMYEAYTTATVEAWSSDCYRFKNWTIGDSIVSYVNPYEFVVTGNVTVVAHFYVLDFDTYCLTLWNNTFMLDLRKLEIEGYNVIGCKWYKNGVEETKTRAIDEFSYSAGPKATDLLEPAPTYYSFRLITRNRGELCSTSKYINNNILFPAPNDKMWAHPNPVMAGVPFTVEGVAKDDEVRVYNQYGICISSAIAAGESIILTLNVQAGVYVVRANEKQVKVVIVR